MSLVENNVEKMLKLVSPENEEFLICLKRYLSMRRCKYSADAVKNTLSFLHTEEAINKLYGYIDNNQNPLEEFVLHCDMQCDDSCMIKDRCYQKKAQQLVDIVNQAEKQLSFDEFSKAVNDMIR